MDFASVIEEQSAALAEAFRQPGALAATVPACPGWSGADLAWHIGEVQSFWTVVVRTPGTEPPAYRDRVRPPDADLPDWYDEVRADLVKAFRETPPDELRWTWWGSGVDTALELCRRQAHEALVHRWDAQSIQGTPEPLTPPGLAADGVREFCERMLVGRAEWSGPPGVVRLAASDAGTDWLVQLDPRPALVESADAVLATVTAPAAELDLWVWRRPARVRVEGDEAVVAAFHALADLD